MLQKLQNRAARIVTGSSCDAPSEPLRKELGWLSVKEMIVKETSTMMYKSLNDLAPQYLSAETQKHYKPTNLVWRKVLAKN